MSAESRVSFFVPAAIDDPARVSGGNVYDQHVRDGLRRRGWEVHMVPIPPDDGTLTAQTLSRLPNGALALVDGLVAARESVALGLQATRLRLVVLAHMVTAESRERDAFRAAKRIIATSGWTRSEIITRHDSEPGDVVVAYPGTDPATTANATPAGDRLLCVGVVAPHKGQDLLLDALAHLTDVSGWTCTFVGSLDGAPAFVDELTRARRRTRLTGRARFTGALAGPQLDNAYAGTDLVVVPSRYESFGMVVTEALARGIPVLASRVGGIPEALSNESAGILVAPEDPRALEVALRHWLASGVLRSQLKGAAVAASRRARPWSATVATIASTLTEVALSETAVCP
ncbi:glycosyltransferase family 4 protein [Cryobacterium sp. RTS3]|uniref:glycosyltransferase family 4 protein n=1 Tax=Cryobacterium sp. RTS3 TaxID=3048643 RepID=UPI002B222FD2|nr:glycosyltransferase family 4 protein [Cryobacterium sp. RTS3]MEA9997731.1 glycosyltransferase family 4 protein [Cryobacterium sp. RTS3]